MAFSRVDAQGLPKDEGGSHHHLAQLHAEHGSWRADAYAPHSAFIAFAPMDNPKIAISVYVEHGGFGADLAAPMAGLIIEQYLKGKLSDASQAKAKRIANRRINK